MVVLACQQCGRHAAKTAWEWSMAAVHITLLEIPILNFVHVGGCYYCVLPQYTVYTYYKFVLYVYKLILSSHPIATHPFQAEKPPVSSHYESIICCRDRVPEREEGAPKDVVMALVGFPATIPTCTVGKQSLSTVSPDMPSLALSSLTSPAFQYCHIRHTYMHNMIKQSAESEKRASTF